MKDLGGWDYKKVSSVVPGGVGRAQWCGWEGDHREGGSHGFGHSWMPVSGSGTLEGGGVSGAPLLFAEFRGLVRVVVGGWGWPFSLPKGSSRLDGSRRGVTGISASCTADHPLESVEIGFRRRVGSLPKMPPWVYEAMGRRGEAG